LPHSALTHLHALLVEEIALIDAFTVVMERAEHRAHHEADFVRWGRRGGLVTLQK